MKNIIFVLGFIFPVLTFASANCPSGTTENVDCWSCGDDCTAYLSDDTITTDGKKQLNIIGSGKMDNYTVSEGDIWHPSVGGYNYDVTDAPWNTNLENITSLNINGVSNIGDGAFEGMGFVQNIQIADSVTSIGADAFNNMALTELKLPESLTTLELAAVAWNNFETFVLPDSVTTIGDRAFCCHNLVNNLFIPESIMSIHDDAFSYLSGETVYCPKESVCANKDIDNLQIYTKDENGVYSITQDGITSYFSSPEKMVAGTTCNNNDGTCASEAAEYKTQKALTMAGGTLCATQQDCLKLMDMASNKANCSSIASCHAYLNRQETNPDGSLSIYKNGEFIGFKNKRIYTLEEANRVAKPTGNTFRIKYR